MGDALPHPDAVQLGTVVRSTQDGRCWQTRRAKERIWGGAGWWPTQAYFTREWVAVDLVTSTENAAQNRRAIADLISVGAVACGLVVGAVWGRKSPAAPRVNLLVAVTGMAATGVLASQEWARRLFKRARAQVVVDGFSAKWSA